MDSEPSLTRYVAVLQARSRYYQAMLVAPERDTREEADDDFAILRERLVLEFPEVIKDDQESSETIITKHFDGFEK